ncbi:glycosyltransferase family 4 protein [Mangrovimonas sp. YM274]|uniref:glycosyltransferase family 4 protein n=1 Tax=Mangrovimonas sp. YM274 TaxID=3070660 RepID=UPI0027DE8E92|nr:MraY family glycosyltransferase [Mangrovimonas sp. YM274]WMI68435.1 MraY family glycosyltransferase [Mangrovimonas sp. YM274]
MKVVFLLSLLQLLTIILTTMNPIIYNFFRGDYVYLWLLVPSFLAFIISFSALPVVIHVAKTKHLVDEPGIRSVHKKGIPTLGGVGIFLGISVVLSLLGSMLYDNKILTLLAGLIVLFFLGIKDDLLVLSPRKKFIGQVFSSLVVIMITDIRIMNFSGIFDVGELPYAISVLFTLFVYVLIINAYNLIDGVDGLAGCIGLLASTCFGMFFCMTEQFVLAAISFITVGALLPFLRHNFSSRQKIFMGDTGSMIIGFLLAFQAVNFIWYSQIQEANSFSNSAPVIALAILFFPLFDTFRVFCIRMFILKKSPFHPDTNHIHHRIIGNGFKHWQTTFIISITSLMIVLISVNVLFLPIGWQLVLLTSIGTIAFMSIMRLRLIKVKGQIKLKFKLT